MDRLILQVKSFGNLRDQSQEYPDQILKGLDTLSPKDLGILNLKDPSTPDPDTHNQPNRKSQARN